MERRRLLVAAATVAAGPVAGCVDGLVGPSGGGSPRSYERCEGRAAIGYREFPAALQAEIDAAIAGGYAPDDGAIRLDDAVDLETTYVVRDGYYVGRVVDETLTLEADPEPTGLDTSRAITVLVRTDVTVELLREGEVLQTFEHNAIFTDVVWGGYELGVDRETGEDETVSFAVDENRASAEVTVSDDGVDVSQAVDEPAACPWSR